MHVGDLLHTQPAELTGTNSAVHTVTAAIICLHYVRTAARARFDLLSIYSNRVNMEWVDHEFSNSYSSSDRDPAQQRLARPTSSRFFIEDVQRGGIVAA